jgi:aminoglycoside N3'-acetyltransferase
MTIFKVEYRSMTAHYGPRFIDADDEYAAKRIFSAGAFSEGEIRMMTARKASLEEVRASMNLEG